MGRDKNSNQPLLTIAIPTYNRAEYLQLNLERLSEELEALPADLRMQILVLIIDNASSDGTDELLARNQNVISGAFTLIRNAENMGGERNVAKCYALAKTPYVWIMGDDDVLLRGGLQAVLDVLCEGSIDILSVGCRPYSQQYELAFAGASKLRSNKLQVFSDPVRFAKRTNITLTFISSLVIKTGRCYDNEARIVEGSNLPQMCWVSRLLVDGNRYGILDRNIIAAKENNSGGYGLVRVFGSNLKAITVELFQARPELAEIFENGAIVNFFPTFAERLRRRDGKYEKEHNWKSDLNELYSGNWRYYIFLAPLISLPKPLSDVYGLMIRIIRRLCHRVII